MLSTSFCAKTATLYSGQNFWAVGPIDISKQNLTEFFFFLEKIFCVKTPTLYSKKNYWPARPRAFLNKI